MDGYGQDEPGLISIEMCPRTVSHLPENSLDHLYSLSST